MSGPATEPRSVVVVGAGSIGLRHIRNLFGLGVSTIQVVEPDPVRRRTAEREGAVAAPDLASALATSPHGALICTPPHLHVAAAAQALEAGVDVFVEKPLSASEDGVEALLKAAMRAGRSVTVGYNLRFHAGLQQLKGLLDDGVIGRLLTVQAEFGQYLPDWRPDRDYRDNYLAQDGGGGIILESSHELDYVRWLAGEVERVAAVTGKVSDLDVADEDVALILLRLKSGALAEVHLDCVQRGYTRRCKLVGTDGTLIWDFETGVRHRPPAGPWREFPVVPEVNAMYVDEIRHWLAALGGAAGSGALATGDDGWRIVQIALAAREASRAGREVPV